MTGGLLNLVATGNQNIILNGNPKKSFFKSTYLKYTNFGLQKFRVDFDGQKSHRISSVQMVFVFVVPLNDQLPAVGHAPPFRSHGLHPFAFGIMPPMQSASERPWLACA